MATTQKYSAEEAAQLTGVTKAALRYYEREQLIGPIERDANNYRHYTADDVDWIKMIKMLRDMGIPIQSLKGVQETSMPERLDYLVEYRQTVRDRINRLEETDAFLATKIDYLRQHKI